MHATMDTESAAERRRLLDAARAARQHAYAPFSRFKVGAALETEDGQVVTGCNVENATYGLTLCAERVAVFKAISEGHRRFRRVAVVADTPEPTPPCGACRQILWEFGGDLEVILGNLQEEKGKHRLRDLLPLPFDAHFLGETLENSAFVGIGQQGNKAGNDQTGDGPEREPRAEAQTEQPASTADPKASQRPEESARTAQNADQRDGGEPCPE